jgi:hypothetical protein
MEIDEEGGKKNGKYSSFKTARCAGVARSLE